MSWVSTYDEPPTEPGWYAIAYCWDVEEGIFTGYSYWDGQTWDEGLPIFMRSSQMFANADDAETWADKNDHWG